MKVTFHHYLNDVRLQRSIGDLLYSDKTVLRLALDNGFPNVASYNKAFMGKYNMRPLDYKQSNAQELNLLEDKIHIHEYLEKISDEENHGNGKTLNIDCHQAVYFNKYWKRVLNLGQMRSFYDKGVQQQLQMLQQNLKFEYIRLTLTMPQHDINDYCFYDEDRIFDTLMNLSFKLWLIIDVRNINEQFMIYFKKIIIAFCESLQYR